MRANAGILIIIGLLFLVGIVGAEIQVNVNGNASWLVAGSGSAAAYTITITNTTTSVPIPNATITFSGYSDYGTMNPVSVITDSNGQATSTFTVGTKSGEAQIQYSINYPGVSGGEGPFTLTETIPQNIDHGILTPKYSPTTGTVGEIISFNVLITDQYGNPIDDRRGSNNVTLYVSCPLPNNCEFIDYGHSFTGQPGLIGNLTIPTKLGTKYGITTIVMNPIQDPVQDLDQQVFLIDTKISTPQNITAIITPAAVPPSSIPTVNIGTGVFTYSFIIADKYGNSVANEPILVNITTGENFSITTNSVGQTIALSYGPKGSIGTVNFTATVVSNPSIKTEFTLAFVSAEPTMSLFVSPLSMSSLDYVPPTKADVVVNVRDDLGNAISGQEIILTLSDFSGGAYWTDDPYLTSYSGTTDSNGEFKTYFIPGNLTPGSETEASCKLTATWTQNPSSSPKTVTITWSNKPYVNVYPEVSSNTVKIGEFIDVTLMVAVNGVPKIDHNLTLIMDHDCSSSMGSTSGGTLSRLQEAALAASDFLDNLNESRTQLGLEAFIGSIAKDDDPAKYHMPIPSAFSKVKQNISLLNGSSSSTEMELSLTNSMKYIIMNTTSPHRSDDIKVIIFLSDGGSNIQNQGGVESINQTAKTNKIHIYTINYNNNGEQGQGPTGMKAIAAGSDGKYYLATNAAELSEVYKDIFNQIVILAGDQTSMTIGFDNIEINKTYTEPDGSKIYDYIPNTTVLDDTMSAPSVTINTTARTSIIWPNGTQSIQNQSTQWPYLIFKIGAIGLEENWSTTFRLKAKQIGCYNLFGDGSEIDFGTGSMPLTLPDIPICVNTTITDVGSKPGTLNVTDLQTQTGSSGPFGDFIPLQWNTYYNSTITTNFATEKIYYKISEGPWIQFSTKLVSPKDDIQQISSVSLDVRSVPRGSTINIWVHATAPDANDADAYLNSLTITEATNPYIILK